MDLNQLDSNGSSCQMDLNQLDSNGSSCQMDLNQLDSNGSSCQMDLNWIQMVPVAKWTSTGFKWFQLPDGPQSTGFKWFQLLINGPQSTGFKWFQLPNGPQINWTKVIPVAYGLKWTPVNLAEIPVIR